jgi:glycosyltransferase involved in cell wall biosynthesis
MKVLHVIPGISKEDGGPSNAIFPMCRALMDQGVDVVLATTDHGIDVSSFESQVPSSKSGDGKTRTRNSELGTRNFYKGVPTIFFPMQLGQSFKYSRPFAQWLSEHVGDYDAVHIHAVFNHACIAAARACRQQRVPYIVRPLGTLDPWSMKQKSLRKRAFWHGGVKRMLSSAAAVHYTAKAEQEATEKLLSLNHGVVVPLGIESSEGCVTTSPKILSPELQSLAQHPYVLVLSRLLPTKGLDVLLDAFVALLRQKEFAHWRLVMAGEGPAEYVTRLRQTAAAANVSDRVLFPGWLDGPAKDAVLQNASILALPSHHENFGLCVMEALNAGVPVLISPQVNLSVEVKAAGAGWVARIDVDSFRGALREAFSSENERLRRGKAGRELAKQFAWPIIATKLNQLYQTIVARHAHTAQTTN